MEVKAEIAWLRGVIGDYLDYFEERKIVGLHLTGDETIYSDIIWAVEE